MFSAMVVPPGTSQVLAACVLLALPGCGKSQESKVIQAIEAAFPGGHRRCLGLAGTTVGIHVAATTFGETLWFASTGVTSPISHAFVFWAGRAAAPVPELVADLAGRGILTKTTVNATVDTESSQLGPQTVSNGYYFHPTLYRHRTENFPVDIYVTKPFDDGFQYVLQTQGGPSFAHYASFPSRLYDTPLPPPDQHYAIPTITPYAVSLVTSACFAETLDGIDSIRDTTNFLGARTLEVDVRYGQHPPDWMLTPAFQRAAIGADTPSITKPRLATAILKIEGGMLSYMREDQRR
jgi:hypothetical protein